MFKTMLTITLLCIVAVAVFWIVAAYQLDRDIDSLIDRAQVGANAEDMLEYLKQLKENMEAVGMTKGHTALIFKNPRNDVGLNYKAVKRMIERLEGVKDLPRDGTAYQTAMDDIRGTIRELPNPAQGWLWVRYLWWMMLTIVALIILTIVAWGNEEA